jgi:type IV secretory pathway VirJ component
VRFSANAGSRERRYIEDLKAAGTVLDLDDAAGETSVPEAMAALIRPRLVTASGDAKGEIASLPLVELPALPHGRFLAIIFSGDGGSSTTDFEISIAGWLGEPASKDAAPTKPALASIDPKMIQCFYGEDESESMCPELGSNEAEIIRVGSGHHFGGDYGALAQDILAGLRRRAG